MEEINRPKTKKKKNLGGGKTRKKTRTRRKVRRGIGRTKAKSSSTSPSQEFSMKITGSKKLTGKSNLVTGGESSNLSSRRNIKPVVKKRIKRGFKRSLFFRFGIFNSLGKVGAVEDELVKKIKSTHSKDGGKVWDRKTCPKCQGEVKECPNTRKETSPYDHDVKFLNRSAEYHCEACQFYIFFNRRSKVVIRTGYTGLSYYPRGPGKLKTKKGGFTPRVSGWNPQGCCVECRKKLHFVSGFAGGAPTGASSARAKLYCRECRYFYDAYEHHD